MSVLALCAANVVGREPQAHLGLPPLATVSTEKAAVGRRLFFDTRLSANREISCATCHQPEHAFSDSRRLAAGIEGRQGTRNTPSVLNAALHTTQFWDGRRATLEEQARDPFVNPVEHGLENHGALLAIVRRDGAYVRDFGVAADAIGMDQITEALASFVRSLASGDSPFDRHYYARDQSAIDAGAKRGFELFQGRAQCAACCDAPVYLRDFVTENHLAPASDLLTQVASSFERLLDGKALGQVRGLAAALHLPPDAGGSFAHLLA